MTVWVHQTRPEFPHGDGTMHGFPTRKAAEEWAGGRRYLRDNSPVFAPFKDAGIDWVVDSRIAELRRTVRSVRWDDISLCPCCAYAAEYGEDCVDCHDPKAILSRIDFVRFSVTNNCPEWCCESSFSWSPCDGCGETGGIRHPYVLWREPQRFHSGIAA